MGNEGAGPNAGLACLEPSVEVRVHTNPPLTCRHHAVVRRSPQLLELRLHIRHLRGVNSSALSSRQAQLRYPESVSPPVDSPLPASPTFLAGHCSASWHRSRPLAAVLAAVG